MFQRLAILTTACAILITSHSALVANWSPEGLLFKPLQANIIEPRVAVLYQFAPEKLRLDIGTAIDLYTVSQQENIEARLGTEFFTYTRLRSEGRFKFPVETTDYYFGINSTLLMQAGEYTISGRLRIAHISSHLIDGYQGPRESFVYSREFVDLVGTFTLHGVRVYAGGNVLFSKIPNNFGLITPQLGFDFVIENFIRETISITGGYDFKLPTIFDTAHGVHSGEIGLKFGMPYGSGIVLSAYAYRGKSVHGMFFDLRDAYGGLGLQAHF